ncbi:MAG: 2-oxoacid:acceptor oxidoreductase family protein [Candidatus Heimdallarchaeota archaeon]|nr:2-oxoacid:acceptor oxidoreductase family protein [Candidatus Heimdallarchaeota archaeon]MCK4770245.1 2-oxoacid:acceptor oxidoreductase family protein [Candidatus Heimdallarchaeota archaeon]
MLEIRFHGRGGTGSVLASRALAKAAFYAGKHAVTFPSFGAERRGAPVVAFVRINEEPIYQRTRIYEPDMIVVLDESLLELIDVAKGLKSDGIGVLNSTKKPGQIKLSKPVKAWVIDANKIACETLGHSITNSVMLGALIRATDIVSLENLEQGILSVFKSKLGENVARKNVEVAEIAYESTMYGTTEGSRNYSDLQPWLPDINELPIGTIIPKTQVNGGQQIGPGSAKTRITGSWSNFKAEINQEKCIQCLQCMFHCPEGTIQQNSEELVVNRRYCKACRICGYICPEKAISMIKINGLSEIIK